jgi:hypothetical protein
MGESAECCLTRPFAIDVALGRQHVCAPPLRLAAPTGLPIDRLDQRERSNEALHKRFDEPIQTRLRFG